MHVDRQKEERRRGTRKRIYEKKLQVQTGSLQEAQVLISSCGFQVQRKADRKRRGRREREERGEGKGGKGGEEDGKGGKGREEMEERGSVYCLGPPCNGRVRSLHFLVKRKKSEADLGREEQVPRAVLLRRLQAGF